jgi:hypothetical protein
MHQRLYGVPRAWHLPEVLLSKKDVESKISLVLPLSSLPPQFPVLVDNLPFFRLNFLNFLSKTFSQIYAMASKGHFKSTQVAFTCIP